MVVISSGHTEDTGGGAVSWCGYSVSVQERGETTVVEHDPQRETVFIGERRRRSEARGETRPAVTFELEVSFHFSFRRGTMTKGLTAAGDRDRKKWKIKVRHDKTVSHEYCVSNRQWWTTETCVCHK